MNKRILVIGGTGMLGRPVALKLKDAGFDVIIFTRNIAEARIKMPTAFEFAEGDIENPASLENAMKGCFAVHINLQGGPKFKDIEKTEYQGVVAIIEAAKKTGIQKITLISGASTSKDTLWYPPSKAKYKAEEALWNSGINFTIFRPSWFFESLPLFVRDNKATIIGKNPHAFHWLAASDYADVVVKTYQTPESRNEILFVLGPEKMTMEEAITRYCKVKHPTAKISNVPSGMLKLIGLITFNDTLKFIAGFMDYFKQVGEGCDEKEREKLPVMPQTTLEEWMARN